MRITHGLARLTGAFVALALMVVAAPAQALSLNVLCTGFTGCLTAGRSDSGYAAVHTRSFWNMTAGHNCTNYAAYRLTTGRITARPMGTGNASTWASAASAAGVPVNASPAVGAIAWWDADFHGAGASGHVAYVEAVLLDGTVLVSEDNLHGDFRWRLMSRLDGAWPSGFIHYDKSDGSPRGSFQSLASPNPGQIDFWATSSDPDAGDGDRRYLASLGGPRGTPGAETYAFTTRWQRFHQIVNVATRGATTMYLYALNEPGTAGADVLLGHRAVTIRSRSATSASMVDRTITRHRRPQVRVSLAPTRAGGTVDIMRGSTLLRRVTMASGSRRTVSLPRQRKGRWSIAVRYRQSATYAASSKTVRLRVR